MTQDEFDMISSHIQRQYGINLAKKKDLIESRLHSSLVSGGYKSFSDYFDFVFSDVRGAEIVKLVDKITTNHTYFFREPKHFEYLRSEILPWVLKNEPSRDLRIWSAGCSSGEEPYTLAMIIDDFFKSVFERWDTSILATDLSTKALETAKIGLYPKQALENIPPDWARKYFTADGDSVVISEAIRRQVIFRRFNLMENYLPFRKKFHVILCRNVMIYFDKKTKDELVDRFYNITEPGGYLFIGHSESLVREDTRYKYIMPAIYRKL